MDRRQTLLYGALGLSITLLILHFIANAFYFYWTLWWYDWMMHFLAGVTGGLSAYWVLFHSGLWKRRSDALVVEFLSVVICLLIVGVAWEIFEYAYGLTDAHEKYYAVDVMNDLLMDTLGAVLAVIIGAKQTFFKHG